MCCLRYEDQTYRELKKNLPYKKTRVGTPEGPGIVLEGKILTQLVLVELEYDQKQVAFPIEDLSDPDTCPRPWEEHELIEETKPKKNKRSHRRTNTKPKEGENEGSAQSSGEQPKKKRRRRRRRKRNTNKDSE